MGYTTLSLLACFFLALGQTESNGLFDELLL